MFSDDLLDDLLDERAGVDVLDDDLDDLLDGRVRCGLFLDEALDDLDEALDEATGPDLDEVDGLVDDLDDVREALDGLAADRRRLAADLDEGSEAAIAAFRRGRRPGYRPRRERGGASSPLPLLVVAWALVAVGLALLVGLDVEALVEALGRVAWADGPGYLVGGLFLFGALVAAVEGWNRGGGR